MNKIICAYCGQRFKAANPLATFCGRRCRQAAWRLRRRADDEPRLVHCARCGERLPFWGGRTTARFCSDRCRAAAHRAKAADERVRLLAERADLTEQIAEFLDADLARATADAERLAGLARAAEEALERLPAELAEERRARYVAEEQAFLAAFAAVAGAEQAAIDASALDAERDALGISLGVRAMTIEELAGEATGADPDAPRGRAPRSPSGLARTGSAVWNAASIGRTKRIEDGRNEMKTALALNRAGDSPALPGRQQ